MKHVETNYVYQNKKLGYTVDEKKGGYSITMDSNDVFLMYKPYLQAKIETEDEYEKLAIKHVENIADGHITQFEKLEKEHRMLLLTNMFVTMYMTYFTNPKFIENFDGADGNDIRRQIEVLLFYEVLIGERRLCISCKDEQFGVHEFFFPKVLFLSIERDPQRYTIEQIEEFEDIIRNKCTRFNNTHDKVLVLNMLNSMKLELLKG